MQLFAAANEQESITYHVTVHGDVSGALKSLSLSRADFFTVILLDALQPDEALLALMKFEIPIVMLLSEGDGPAVIRNCIRRGADAASRRLWSTDGTHTVAFVGLDAAQCQRLVDQLETQSFM